MHLFKFAVLAALVCLCSACTREFEQRDESGLTKQDLHISIGASPQSLDPHLVTGVPAWKVLGAIGEPLLALDLETLDVKPAVAENWSVSEDGLLYTFSLRKDARWSDGSAVTAEDFVFTWRRAMMGSVGWQYATDYYVIKGAEAYHQSETPSSLPLGVKAISSHTLEFELTHPHALFLKQLTSETMTPINSQALLTFGKVDDIQSAWTLPGNHVSNGPFTLEKWELNKIILLKKNPYYWDADNVKLETVHIYPLETESAEERAFRSGQIQVAFGGRVPVNKIAGYLKNSPSNIKIVPACGMYNYYINTSRPPFNDIRVRHALSHAIDREAIVKNITKAGEQVATRFVPHTPGYSDRVTPLEYDVEKAKTMLAEAGYPNGEGFPAFTLIYNTSDVHRKIALAIQQMWKTGLGIDIELENQEWKVFLSTWQTGDYDVSRSGGISGIGDPQDFLESYKTGHGMNRVAWSNDEYDSWVEMGAKEQNLDKRYEYLAKAEDILLADMPTIPIYFYIYSYLVAEEVKGLNFNALGRLDFKSIYIEDPE